MGGLLLAVGCADAVYTLGHLPGDGPGVDASTSDAQVGKPDASGGTGGSAGFGGQAATSGSGGTGGAGGTMACQVKRTPAEFKGLNLYLMVDSSIGIAFQPVWPQVIQAVTMFVDDSANAGLGLGINYYGVSCDAGTYAAPRVAVAELPGVASEVRMSFPVPFMGVGAVIAAAVDGAIQYAAALEGGNRDRETEVVILGDAFFDIACSEGINDAVAYAGAGFASTPSVKTHVIGIDAIDPLNTSDLTALDNIAAAGGTGRARRISVNASSAVQIYDALMLVTRSSKPCEVKQPDGSVLERLEMEWLPEGDPVSTPYIWPRLAAAAACGPRTGFYPSANLGYLQLCPAACDVIRAGPSGTLSVREDCP